MNNQPWNALLSYDAAHTINKTLLAYLVTTYTAFNYSAVGVTLENTNNE